MQPVADRPAAPADVLRPSPDPAGAARWIVYQRERFPLLAHAPLIAAFSGSAVCFSALLRGGGAVPSWASLAVAFVSCLLFFFQLRVSDEFKDAAEDARHRPYRPVPRGLVTLRELGTLAIGAAAVQLALALWLDAELVPLLLLVWGYLGLMHREFFVGEWLERHPVTVIWTHMLILPLIDLYATATDWVPAGTHVVDGLRWFLVASFFNGIVIEIGRKIRAPEQEEPGVRTYSAIWGPGRAVAAWLAVMVVTGAAATLAAARVDFALPVAIALAVVLLTSAIVGARFLADRSPSRARLIEPLAGIWTLLMYLGIGVVPLLLRRWAGVGA